MFNRENHFSNHASKDQLLHISSNKIKSIARQAGELVKLIDAGPGVEGYESGCGFVSPSIWQQVETAQ